MSGLAKYVFALSFAMLQSSPARAADATLPVFRETAFECKAPLPESQTTTLMADVERHYQDIADLSGSFVQSSYFIGSDEQKVSGGQVYFKRPGMMDWVYQQPDAQRFVSDGKTVWWHQPRENQVTLRSFRESFSSDVPVSFLLGVGKLRENFKMLTACTSSDGTVLKLQPLKTNANLNEFYLLVDKKDHAPIGARIFDIGGNETSILFEDTKLNSGVQPSRFAFEIPKGTDVIDERFSDAAAKPETKE